MIPASFAYDRPASLEEAFAWLAAGAGAARPLAGGQSLLPVMKLRLARPERLVDIGAFDELRGVRGLEDGRTAIGALTTWADLLANQRVMAYGLLADAIPTIGDVQVRNRGTIGGSLAHADPASDIAAPLLALDAELVVRSAGGERILAMRDLDAGPFMTSLAPDELITEVRLPGPRDRVGSAYVAIPHPASGYPVAGVAAVIGPDLFAVAVTGVGEQPYRATTVEAALRDGASGADAVATIADDQRVLSDPYADRDYRAAMARVVAERALAAAIRRAG
jgi:carbon-monoxide dehydrogenase medium subunit